MRCPYCNQKLKNKAARFCPHCGRTIEPKKRKKRSPKTILIVCGCILILAAAGVIALTQMYARKALDRRAEAWQQGDIGDLMGTAIYRSEDAEKEAKIRGLEKKFGIDRTMHMDADSLLGTILANTTFTIDRPLLIRFPLETTVTIEGPDMAKLMENLTEKEPEQILQALRSGQYGKRTTNVPVTLRRIDGKIYADPSDEALRAIYGGAAAGQEGQQ